MEMGFSGVIKEITSETVTGQNSEFWTILPEVLETFMFEPTYIFFKLAK